MNDTVALPIQPQSEPPKTPKSGTSPATKGRLKLKRDMALAYIRGDGSLDALSKRFKVSISAAKEWASKGNWSELRRAYDDNERAKLVASTLPATPTPAPMEPELTPLQVKLASVEGQLVDIDKELGLNPTADVREKLWRAKERALNAWALLTGFPKPGTRRTNQRGRSLQPIAVPIPQNPEPLEPQ